MPIDETKVNELAKEVNTLEHALAAARARLMDAVTGAANGSAAVPQVSQTPVIATKVQWGAVTEAILAYADKESTFKVRSLFEHLQRTGYKSEIGVLKARVHQLLRDKRLKKVSPGIYKRA
jgi:hypothetical protein